MLINGEVIKICFDMYTLGWHQALSLIVYRVESYSCKMAGSDKKLYKLLNIDGEKANDLQALSPSQQSFMTQTGSPVITGNL